MTELVSSIRAGTSVNGEERPRENGEQAVLKVSAVSKSGFKPRECKVVMGAEQLRLSTPVSAGTIAFSRSNTPELVGLSAYVEQSDPSLYHSDKLWQISANKENVLPRFLGSILLLPELRREFTKRASGSSGSMYNISQTSFLSCVTSVPCLCEQEAILGILGDADAALRGTERTIEKKVAAKAAIAEELLTGHRRFPGCTLPWCEYRLGDLFVERVEMNRSDLKLLSVTGADGVVDRDTLVKRDTSSEDKSKYLRVCPGDIAYNTMRMWQGVFGLSCLEGIVSPAYTICTPRIDIILPNYVEQLFKLPHTIHNFKRYSQGLVDDTLNLKYHHFAEVKVTIPDVEEQCRISTALGQIDQEIALLRSQRDALNDQKKGLMQKLLTGEVRLKEFR